MENTYLLCEKCGERSKYPVGFWDGEDCGGLMWDCDDINCTIKQERDAQAANETAKKHETHRENKQNGVDVTRMKWLRTQAHCSVRDLSFALGITSAKYSGYEVEREAMPFCLYRLAVAYLNRE